MPTPPYFLEKFMDTILEQVQVYLSEATDGSSKMDEKLIEEFGERCKAILRRQFNEPRKKFTLRMSSIGRPLCQQQMEMSGETRNIPYHAIFKMLVGDIIEAAAVAVMKAAKVKVDKTDGEVTLKLDDGEISGTYDIKINGKIYDIKSASPYAYTNKFAKPDGFSAIRDDDPFGYIAQGYLYAEADKSKFGGWIVINKSTGEWCITRPPLADNAYRKEALKLANTNYSKLKYKSPFARAFSAIEETFNGKSTRNKYLGITCTYCPFKDKCWESEGQLFYVAQPASKAKNPRRYWYVGVPK